MLINELHFIYGGFLMDIIKTGLCVLAVSFIRISQREQSVDQCPGDNFPVITL
jgi:hypothetical protein